jgi:hypothetical protein
MRAIGILRMQGGVPVGVVTGPIGTPVDNGTVLVQGYNLLAQVQDIGIYLLVGKPAALAKVNAATANCAGGFVLENQEMTEAIPAAMKNRMNTWLTARSLPNIPAGWTWLQLLRYADTRFNALHYSLSDPDDMSEVP